ncbi:MAG: helix-turn-helix domain-containing protein [Myxococcota bacterium]
MKAVSELDHYELLELPVGADPAQIEKAYKTLRATYAADSMAVYSILEPSEAEQIRERIEGAYRVLSDEEERHRYDVIRAKGRSGMVGATHSALEQALPKSVEVPEEAPTPEGAAAGEPSPGAAASILDDADECNGRTLQQLRLQRGVALDQLAATTKISPNTLRCIEEDRYDELPALVYVRGFVIAYARALGFDSEKVANRYMEHLESSRGVPRRSRFLGRD